jgi:hypothetical protein
MPKIVSIKSVGIKPQKCISVSAPDGLFIVNDSIITHNSDTYIWQLYNDLKKRVESRMKGHYLGRTILDSSPNELESPIDTYCMYEADKNEKNLVIKGSVWDWCPEEVPNVNVRFPLYLGHEGKPPRVITPTEEPLYPRECVLKVPEYYRQYFIDDVYKSLKDYAGIPTSSNTKVLHDHSKIDEIF